MKEPIPIVRAAVQELIASGRIINARMRVKDRSNLEDAIQLGAIIQRLRDGCSDGEYLPALEKIDVPRQRASEYLRLHEASMTGAPVIKDCDSIRSALDAIQLHKLAQQNQPAEPEKPGEREPGDDTEEEARQPAKGAGRNGAALFDWRGYEKPLGVVNRLPDLLARAYPEARATEDYRAASAALDEFSRRWAELKRRLTGRRK